MASMQCVTELVSKHDRVHLKGFAGNIDFKNPNTVACLRRLVGLLWSCKEVVFDGDNFKPGSYVEILQSLPTSIKLVAYKKQSDVPAFRGSYTSTGLDIEVREAPNDLSWDELGEYALRDTGATLALCFGCGGTVKKEFERMGSTVQFMYFPVTRQTKGKTEQCSLIGVEGAIEVGV